ncbi:DegT/DnrJ/EryC1/StrS family aminotransferase [Herbaspirillum lusitanum]|uniref:DegT/DnrJ/EryC1/StrS family aminotransferase n=1 Tax=Herbaspirillum lusitanum TaxID=213312 RepID=A0ABW9A3Z6_9BURK
MKHLPISYADWSGAEYRSALLSLLSGGLTRGAHGAGLAAEMGASYQGASVYPVNYAHTALEMALAAFMRRMPARTQVLVPAYVCPIVVQSIAASGLDPVPLEIADDLNLLPAAVAQALDEHGGNTLAVVAPHMFGCPARIAEIEALCRSAGVFLIDDAAQLAGIEQEGKLLGGFGDVGLISFAQSKTIVTGVRGSGGILLVNNPELDADISAAFRQLPPPSGRLQALVEFLWNYLWTPVTGSSGDRLADIGARLGWRQPMSAPRQQARIGNLDAGIARVQLQRLSQIHADKKRIAEIYHHEFLELPEIGFPQYAPGRYLSRIMLSLPEGSDLGACRAYLHRQRIESRLGYKVPFSSQASTRKAERLATGLLGLPCGPAIGAAQVRSIRSHLQQALHLQRRGGGNGAAHAPSQSIHR